MPIHFVPTGLLRITSNLLTTSGVVLALVSTLGEHINEVVGVCGILAAIVGFWFRSWIVKRETFESETRKAILAQEILLAGLQAESKDLMRDFAEEIRLRRRESERVENFRLWMVATLSAVASKMRVSPPQLPTPADSGETRLTDLCKTKED
jgi:hypothetical protein